MMSEVERKKLLKEFQKGNYKPLIIETIIEKWKAHKDFTWREIYLELQEITKTKHSFKFAQSLRECLDDAQASGMYYNIADTFVYSRSCKK